MPIIDMSDEDYSKKGGTIPAAYYPVKIIAVSLKTSDKSKEKYFLWEVVVSMGEYYGHKLEVMTTAIKGKRWLLKQLLESSGVQCNDGVFKFEYSDVIGKEVTAKVSLKTERFIGRSGEPVEKEKNSISEFKKIQPQKQDGENLVSNEKLPF